MRITRPVRPKGDGSTGVRRPVWRRSVAGVAIGATLGVAACESPGCRTPQLTAADVDVETPEEVVLRVTLTHDGEPVPNAVIQFRVKVPPENGGEVLIGSGFTDADGLAHYNMGEVGTVVGSQRGYAIVATGYIAEFREPEAVNDVAYCFVSDDAKLDVEHP